MSVKTEKDLYTQGLEYCKGCVKFSGGKCTAFKKLWPEFKEKGECWAREEDLRQWKETLSSIKTYHEYGDNQLSKPANRVVEELREVENKLHEAAYEGWREVYESEVHKPLAKPGGGEKADRTNKTFGPQQMKDNRFMHRKLNPRKYQ